MSIGMHSVYIASALGGGALLLIQAAFSVFGSHDGDIHFDAPHELGGHDASDDMAGGGLSFRTAVAFISFFGVGGWVAMDSGFGGGASLAIAVVTGSIAFWLVGLALTQMNRLRASGTIDIQNTLGVEGTVYLTVPGERGGEGSVTVPIQGRTMQFKAVTRGREIKTGHLCRVVAVASSDTLEVESI